MPYAAVLIVPSSPNAETLQFVESQLGVACGTCRLVSSSIEAAVVACLAQPTCRFCLAISRGQQLLHGGLQCLGSSMDAGHVLWPLLSQCFLFTSPGLKCLVSWLATAWHWNALDCGLVQSPRFCHCPTRTVRFCGLLAMRDPRAVSGALS